MDPDRTSFDVAGFLSALPPGLGVGGVVVATWRLDEVVQAGDRALRITLRDDATGAFEVLVTPRDQARPAYARSPHLDVIYLRSGGGDPVASQPGARTALALLCLAIIKADPPSRRWDFGETEGEPATPVERELTLSIAAPCGARCIFCGQLELTPPRERFDRADHERLIERLRRGRRQGISTLRLTGLDPLAYPWVVDLIASAVDQGYEEVLISTFGPRLADPGLVGELAAALPRRRRLDIPLQGDTAGLHDRITGSPGSWSAVMRALEHLSARFEPEAVHVEAVILRQNLSALGRVRQVARSFGFRFGAHLSFPNRGGRRDPYHQVTPRISRAVAELHGLSPPLPVREAPPCVTLRHERATGIPSFSELVPRQAPLVGRGDARRARSGGRAARATFSPALVRCPHAGRCELADRCGRMVYREYAELYGLDELAPVLG